ncbi:MAG: hypothetical protein AAF694_00110 [Bacteroidota bacterium]
MKALYVYQKERFPIVLNTLLIGVFTGSAMLFSQNLREVAEPISWGVFLPGLAVTFTTFFLLRILDEFKDYEIDKTYRPHLPVHRGVISLSTLRVLGISLWFLQLFFLFRYLPSLWPMYLLIIGYMALMSVEFFVPKWLESKPLLYVFSHMIIVPLVDLFASSLDWSQSQVQAPKGLYILLVVSFLNGCVLEFGRKIKAPENEEFNSYSRRYGIPKSIRIWLISMGFTLGAAWIACSWAGYPLLAHLLLSLIVILALFIGIQFLKNPGIKGSQWIEGVSALWTLVLYLIVGCYPQLVHLSKNLISHL